MATTPPWIVQSSPTGASKAPAWVVSSTPTTLAPTTPQFDMTKQGTHDDFFNAYTQGDTSKYGDAIKMEDVWVGGEGGANQTQKHIDWSKLPNEGMTKYGRIGEQVVKVNNPEYIKDKSKIVFDPAYGWVTPKGNEVIEHNLVGQIMKPSNVAPMMMAGAFGGLAGIAGLGGLAGSAIKAVPGLVTSAANGSFNPMSLGLSALGASGYVPSWVVPAVKAGMSLSQMYGKG